MSYKDRYIDQEAMDNKAKFDSCIDEYGRLDVGAIYEGAKGEEEARAKEQQELRDRQRAIQEAQDKELTDLLTKASEKIAQDKKLKADREIADAKAKAEQEIEAALYKKNGVRVETEIEKSLKSLLGGLNLNEMD